MSPIDLRSDTVTRPTPAMRRAMAEAEVGDDVYGEDPTVNLLERRAAEITGKEAALFVPTGTMGNTIAIKLHTRHGQEVICDARSHILNYEHAMLAWFAGCVARPVQTADGILDWRRIRAEIRTASIHGSPTGLIEVENTNNIAGGTVYPLDTLREICGEAHAAGLPVHMDGARVFNAAAALGVPVSEIVSSVDTVMFCLSKALGAPAGSMLAGPRELIEQGRIYRKALGGGMRQTGVLAAAGLIALEQMPARLPEDHANARWLTAQLRELPGIAVESEPQTNIVFFDVSGTGLTGAGFCARLKEAGVIMNATGPYRVRLLTHFDVDREACRRAIEAIASIVRGPDVRTLASEPAIPATS